MTQEDKNWYDNFLELLNKKYPKRQELVQELIKLLIIEREAVYRRLRKDVVFTVHEMAKISLAWDISIDDMISASNGTISFRMRKMNHLHPTHDERKFIKKVIDDINYASHFPTTEFLGISNKLPRQILAGFPNLDQFYLFKWLYQYNSKKVIVPFSQIVFTEEIAKLTKEYYEIIKQIPNSSFIIDRLLFEYLVSDIQYFHSIQLITDDEKKLIKQDLLTMLEYMQEIAGKGYYPETKNKVNLYVSYLQVDTNYCSVYTPEVDTCFVHVFEKFEIYTYNSEMATKFRTWMTLKRRSSVQISEVDEKNRIEYFSRQRKLIDIL